MSAILRFNGGVKHDTAIDRWLDGQNNDLGAIARTWFNRIRECGDNVVELMHDGCPTACVTDAAFAYVNVFKAHVNVGFFRGASLPDPAGLLEGTGKYMRHVKLRTGAEVDVSALRALIKAAHRDIMDRLRETE